MILDRYFRLGEGVWSGWEMNKFLSSKNQEAKKEKQLHPPAPPPPKAKQSCLVLSVFVLKMMTCQKSVFFAFISISNLPRHKHMCIPP